MKVFGLPQMVIIMCFCFVAFHSSVFKMVLLLCVCNCHNTCFSLSLPAWLPCQNELHPCLLICQFDVVACTFLFQPCFLYCLSFFLEHWQTSRPLVCSNSGSSLSNDWRRLVSTLACLTTCKHFTFVVVELATELCRVFYHTSPSHLINLLWWR